VARVANLTIRNIPEDLLNNLRKLSQKERRSLNSEVLVLLEKSVMQDSLGKNIDTISIDAQTELWSKLAGEWEDSCPTEEIIDAVLARRTPGREVEL
jgi:plasmid stability protein